MSLEALLRLEAHTPSPHTSPVWASVSLAENRDNPNTLSLVFSGVLEVKNPFTRSFIHVQVLFLAAFGLFSFPTHLVAVAGWGLNSEVRAVEMLPMPAMVVGISVCKQERVCAVWVFLTRHITKLLCSDSALLDSPCCIQVMVAGEATLLPSCGAGLLPS